MLLPAKGLDAKNIMALVSECGSAKQVIISVQEAIERLQNQIISEGEEAEETETDLSLVGQLDMLISLYASGTSWYFCF